VCAYAKDQQLGDVVMNRKFAGVATLATAVAFANPVLSQSLPRERGQAIAEKHCARCHAIDDVSASPMGLAPPFRDLSKRYAIENLAEALAEGIVTGHPAMPRFTFEPREIDALLTFMISLTAPGERPSRGR
jgi:cytochrome c